MLRIDSLTYRIGARVLLDQTSATISPGHRVGLVGRNGTGKTTLLHLITGDLEADNGHITIPPRWTIGATSQEAPGGEQSLIDTVLASDKELVSLNQALESGHDPHGMAEIHARLRDKEAHSAPARAARILAGLGFDEEAQQRPCGEFSGGWRMRVALAALLFTQPDLLLLDEPTNHLDLEASMWLESYLKTYPGTILIVSHDRGLLNRVVDEILHLEDQKLILYKGGYDRFEATRRMQLEQNAKMRVKQDAQRDHIRKFVERFRYKPTKAKQAQSRLKMLEKMEPIPERREGGSVTFGFPDPASLSSPLFNMDDVTVGYDDKPVLNNLNLSLNNDDRIALIGANGIGKSTLIRLLAGKLRPLSGRAVKSGKLRIGYFAQHQGEELDLTATPLIEMKRRRPRETEQQARSQLGRFGFEQQKAETTVGNLSGGEKARLLFALMSADKPNILLLDEPTNHLDIASRQALVQAVNAFEGAVVLVSHDHHLIEATADRLWLVEDGKVAPYEGDLEDYRKELIDKRRGNSRKESTGGETRVKLDKKELRRIKAEKRKTLAPLKNKLHKAEKHLHELEAQKKSLSGTLADPTLYDATNGQSVDLQKELGEVEKAIEIAEADWETLHNEVERIEAAETVEA